MNFFYAVVIPKNTPKSAPYEMVLPLSFGEVTTMDIIIPAGHAGKAHLWLLFQGTQIFPLNPGGDYYGDDAPIHLDSQLKLTTSPYEFIAKGYNLDQAWDHRFLVNINLVVPTDNAPAETDFTVDYYKQKITEIFGD